MDMGGGTYLVSLDLAAKKILVVGAGKVAARKIQGLPENVLSLTVISPEISKEVEELLIGPTRRAHYIVRRIEEPDLLGHDLVFAATSDPFLNSEIARLAGELGILVNNVSASEDSTFTNVAVVHKGGISIGVSSNPKVPGFSMAVGKLIEEVLPEDIDRLLVLAADVRSKALNYGHSPDGLDWIKVLNSRVFEYIRLGDFSQAEESLIECLL
ncbi:MAG: bifunctional precorrin-2 dehydrogenase/sirohydrochlorin ferrochelatase [Acidimicrobiaceae bacterium]|nr:bifunctional precorrin-2 dehydrogenase/sirohydrochlorin ferrochelatase [Acidimicrobiaceae bacterium]